MFSNNNISKGKATAESVLENLKSLSEKTSVNLKNLSKNALGELGIGSSTSVSPKKLLDLKTPKILNSEQTSISNFSNSQSITIIRYILAFLIIGFIWPYDPKLHGNIFAILLTFNCGLISEPDLSVKWKGFISRKTSNWIRTRLFNRDRF